MKEIQEMEIPKSEIDMYFGKSLMDKLVDHCQVYVEEKHNKIMEENIQLKNEN
jgi:hypothetical protein